MAIALNHMIVPATDREAAASLFAELFGLEVGRRSPGSPPGHFAVVRVGDVHFDFADREEFEPHHYAFHVGDEEFDAILTRVVERDLPWAADPRYRNPGELNRNEGGRGVYFRTPDGHNLELLTRIPSRG